MGDASSVVPRPMCSSEAVQWLMFADTFDQGMPGGFVVTALDVEGTKPRFEDHRCQGRSPGFQQVYEGLIGRELSKEHRWKSSLKISTLMHITLVEAQCRPSILYVSCLVGVPLWQVFITWAVNHALELEVRVGVNDAVGTEGRVARDGHRFAMQDDISQCHHGRSCWFVELTLA